MFAVRSARLPLTSAIRSVAPRSTAIPVSRSFHISRRCLASEPNVEELKAAFKSSPLFQKLQKSEGAMNAVKELAEVFQRKGIDTTTKPSMMTMAKWTMDSDIRAAISNIMTEFQKAGIDLSKENLPALFGNLGGKK